MIRKVNSPVGWVYMVMNRTGYQYGRTFYTFWEAVLWRELIDPIGGKPREKGTK